MNVDSKIILALDVTNRDDAMRITKEVQGYVVAIKIGYPLVLAAGLDIIDDISYYAPVIADFKVADIPNTNKLICEQAFEMGASAIIAHGFVGRDSVEVCVDIADENGGIVFVVCDMSHTGGMEYIESRAEDMARMAADVGAYGIVAPATRPEYIKKLRDIIGNSMTIISPGVGTQGGSIMDAIKAGADFVIVGRSIYNAESPKEAIEKIMREV
jgi:orotidine-5'-phosphate decarboxylase